jgi:hypothetical protein
LLDGGDVIFLWLGEQLSPGFLQDLFMVQAKSDVPDAAEVEFGDHSMLASKMSLIVGQLRRDRNGTTHGCSSRLFASMSLCQFLIVVLLGHPPVRIVHQKSPTEVLFFSRLLEDK